MVLSPFCVPIANEGVFNGGRTLLLPVPPNDIMYIGGFQQLDPCPYKFNLRVGLHRNAVTLYFTFRTSWRSGAGTNAHADGKRIGPNNQPAEEGVGTSNLPAKGRPQHRRRFGFSRSKRLSHSLKCIVGCTCHCDGMRLPTIYAIPSTWRRHISLESLCYVERDNSADTLVNTSCPTKE